jgi:hypothetical protein
MREAWTLEKGDVLYTVSRIVNRRRVHLEYASNGKPMLWGGAQARAAIAKATGGTA